MTRAAALLLAGLCAATAAMAPAAQAADTVTLQGMLGAKALLVINGGVPRSAAPGETVQGVKVLSTAGDQAVVEFNGTRRTLRVGEVPGVVGTRVAPAGTRIVLPANSGGHFLTPGAINGKTVQFMVDTGATNVSMGVSDAERLGLSYKSGQPVRMSTANGVAAGWHVKLATVRVGDVEVHEVDAIVSPQSMPVILLGNSFLSRFQMKRENDLLTLERRF